MEIETLKVGDLETNCYLLKKNNNYLIIDPGSDIEKIKKNINGKVLAILLTHRHFDHIGALDELEKCYQVPVYDFNSLNEDKITIGKFTFDVIYTPGHTIDSITFYFKNEQIMFVGDFIFKSSIGRTDLGGNMKEMLASINKIKQYDDNITLYPGHGVITTLKDEKLYNPFFKETI